MRRLEYLQWFGLVAGGALWLVAFLGGVGVAVAACNPAAGRFAYDTVQIVLLCAAAGAILAAETASVLVFRATRALQEDAAPPGGRMKLLAVGAMAGNLVFLAIVALSLVATVVDRTCVQS